MLRCLTVLVRVSSECVCVSALVYEHIAVQMTHLFVDCCYMFIYIYICIYIYILFMRFCLFVFTCVTLRVYV